MTKHDQHFTVSAIMEDAMHKARVGQNRAASELAQTALDLAPRHSAAQALIHLLRDEPLPESAAKSEALGRVALSIGALDAAEKAFAMRCKIEEASAEHFALWGSVAQARSDTEIAWNRFSRALALDPENITARTGVAVVHWMRGNLVAARTALEKVVNDAPDTLNPQYVLTEVLFAQGDYAQAIKHLDGVLRRHPTFLQARQLFLRCLAKLPLGVKLLADNSTLEDCYDFNDIEIESLAQASLVTLLDDPHMAAFWQGGLTDPGAVLEFSAAAPPLFMKVLRHQIISDFRFETGVQKLRNTLLSILCDGDPAPEPILWLAEAVAQQSWLTEYLVPPSDAEAALLAELGGGSDAATTQGLLAQALFRPLTDLPAARKWLMVEPHAPILSAVMLDQVCDPDQERIIAQDLPELGLLKNEVSCKVNAQYEANPYPRWRTLSRTARMPVELFLKRQFAHWQPQRSLVQAEILVAGCGTGRDLIGVAGQFDASDVTGIDLSRASLAYGTRMARKMGIDSVNFLHGDILDLADLGRQFDVIVSSGVLHHMAEPLAGWQTLVDCLRPSGVMKIALYSEVARQGVVAGQTIVRDMDLPATQQGIAKSRGAIAALPIDHPAQLCPTTRDFYYQSGVRDLIFHVQEHRFTLPKLAEALDQLGLRLIGFELPGDVMANYRTLFPDDPDATNLVYWDAYERLYPLTFLQMYQFWCERRPT